MSGLISPDTARSAVKAILELPGSKGVEVVVASSATGLTRFAGSRIIQSTERKELRVYVRVSLGDRVATAVTNQLDADHLEETASRALRGAHAALPDDGFPGLVDPADVGRAEPVDRFDEETASAGAGARAEAVADVLSAVGPASAAGIYETSAHSFAVFSSAGIDCHDAYSRCVVTCLAERDGVTGWGEASSHRRGDVDVAAAAERAAAKIALASRAEEAPPGRYEVVLEPSAVATLVDYLAYMGFGAKQVLEGESFLAELAGEVVGSPAVTVADDVWHPSSVGIGFDFEGAPRRRVAVIEEGRAVGPVTDSRTARATGRPLTGHSSGSDEVGPYASNVVMAPGDASPEDLIAGVSDGLLVTRFHYVNILDRAATLLTGMTRDGTFRIRDGEITGHVNNLRFAQKVLDVFAATTGIGRDLHAFAPEYGSFGSTVVPALRAGEFEFASATSH